MSVAADSLGVGIGSRVLELLEPCVDLERLGEALRALGSDVVALEAASKCGAKVSAATDSSGMGGRSSALERRERRVDRERLRDVLGSLGSDTVVLEAANEGAGTKVSAAADTMVGGGWRRTRVR